MFFLKSCIKVLSEIFEAISLMCKGKIHKKSLVIQFLMIVNLHLGYLSIYFRRRYNNWSYCYYLLLDGFSLMFEWQKVTSSLQDPSQYSGCSKKSNRGSNPAGLCCLLTHKMQCVSNEPSSFTNPNLLVRVNYSNFEYLNIPGKELNLNKFTEQVISYQEENNIRSR